MSNQRIHLKAHLSKELLLASAVEQAHEALLAVTPAKNVGQHAGMIYEAERVLTHAFECLLPGYRGWYWTVTLSRVPRGRKVTVDEVSLRPGDEALLAPEWIPWADRLRPGDIGPSDRLAYNPHDPNLQEFVPEYAFSPDLKEGYESVGIDADIADDWELGLGRARVLSETGKADAFRRWYRSDAGPKNQATRDAKAQCSTCGYLMKMAGSARQLFGVCANEWSPFDGRAVSVDHGCGAHSETDEKHKEQLWVQSDPVINEADLEIRVSE